MNREVIIVAVTTLYTEITYVVCSANTDKTDSRFKDYSITKYNTNDQDVGVWLCGPETLGWSNPRVAVIGKYILFYNKDQSIRSQWVGVKP